MKLQHKLLSSTILPILLAMNPLFSYGDYDFIENNGYDNFIKTGDVVTIENEPDIVLSDTNLIITNASQLNLIDTNANVMDTMIIGGLFIGPTGAPLDDIIAGDNTVYVIASGHDSACLSVAEELFIGNHYSDNNTLFVQGNGCIDWEVESWEASAIVLAYSAMFTMDGDNSYGNSIILRDGAMISGHDGSLDYLYNIGEGIIDIGAGCVIYTDEYGQTSDSVLRLGISEESYGRLFTYHRIYLQEGASIEFYGVGNVAGSIENMKFIGGKEKTWIHNDFYIDRDAYHFGDEELLAVLNDKLNIDTVSSLLNVELKWIEDDDGSIWLGGDLTRIPLATCSGLEGTSLGLVADDIDTMAAVSGSSAASMIDRFNLMTGDEQRLELEAIYDEQLPVANTQIQAMHDFSRVLHSRTRKNGQGIDVIDSDGPAGAMATKNEWQSWMKTFGSITDVDCYDGHESYDYDNYGTVIGLDKVEDALTYGLAFGITQSDLESGNGNSANSDSYYGAFYGSYDADDWFVDFSLSYGYADIDARSGSVFDITADYSADIFSFYLGTGKEFGLTDFLFIIPVISLQTTYYDQESYREDSSDAVGKDVDGYDRWSYLSTVGATLELRNYFKNSSVTPELHAFWEHEFNTDEDDVSYSLIGGTTGHSFNLQSPVADIVRLGFGISSDVTDNVKLSAGYDIRLGDDYSSQSANAKLIYSF